MSGLLIRRATGSEAAVRLFVGQVVQPSLLVMRFMKKKVAIAGASGFIGRWFMESYKQEFDIIGLSRAKIEPDGLVAWRRVDLYSLSSTTEALRGVDFAIYLVHSMSPSSRLDQSSFEDTDLLLADNFARAAEQCGLAQIVYIGGILPKETEDFSTHLQSRYETEQMLGSRATPLTALRAGIVIGPGGSSFEVVKKLTERLPVMACPQWCQSPSQPIDIRTMLQCIRQSLGNPATYHKAIEVGGHEETTYLQMLKTTARLMGKKRLIFPIPLFSLGLSKAWVALFSDSSTKFISPLVESLKHDMRVRQEVAVKFAVSDYTLAESIAYALSGPVPPMPRRVREPDQERNTVRSVQRMPNPANRPSAWVAEQYPLWLSAHFRYLLKVRNVGQRVQFELMGIRLLELEFIKDRSDEERQLFYIVGGKLVKRRDHGWLEFRSVLGNRFVISAIHEFVPSLPWYFYRYTQAIIHLWVMNRYRRFLIRQRVISD